MKRRNLFAAVILISTAAFWFGGCGEKTPGETPGTVIVETGTAKMALPAVTLPGFFSGNRLDVSAAGFMWGDSEEMNENAAAVISGNDFTATISVSVYNKVYYYRGYVVCKGETILGSVKTFTADHGDKLQGKEWLELPAYNVADGQVAKAYYSTFNNNVQGRNYSILYDPTYVLSLWVAFPMNKDVHLGSQSSGTTINWRYDTSGDIPTSAQANLAAGGYEESNLYQRGHQLARADRSCTSAAATQTYTATNSTPQLSGFNGGIWGTLEDEIRKVVKNNSISQDTLYVVTGPIMGASPGMAHDKDGKECPIPDKYFKVVLWSKYVADGEPRTYDTIGFIMENASGQSGYANYARSVSYVEGETGFNFFGNLGLGEAEMTALKSTSSWSEFSSR